MYEGQIRISTSQCWKGLEVMDAMGLAQSLEQSSC